MGFFQDLKEDLSQAVNELMPDESLENLEEETIAEETVEATVESITETVVEPVTETVPEVSFDDPMSRELAEMLAALEQPEAEGVAEAEAETMEVETQPEVELTDEVTESAVVEEFMPTYEESAMNDILAGITVEENEKGEENSMDTQFMNHDRMALDETATITGGMKIKGDVQSEGSMDVIGTIEGNIDILGKLNVTGTIQGTSKAAEVYAEGANITGDVISEGTIKIGQSSVIIGNLTATSAVIAGAVKGDIDVKGPVILDASAIVMGNIKSKSVQINNGAVIEGLCSQCYADVNPTSFFDDLKKAAKK